MAVRAAAAWRTLQRLLPAGRPRRARRAAGYGVSARAVSTCIAAPPALLVLFATRARVSPAQRTCDAGARRRGFETWRWHVRAMLSALGVTTTAPAPRRTRSRGPARDRMAMAEIRESGKPFDCLAFCGAIQRMLDEGQKRPSFFGFSKKTSQNIAS